MCHLKMIYAESAHGGWSRLVSIVSNILITASNAVYEWSDKVFFYPDAGQVAQKGGHTSQVSQ